MTIIFPLCMKGTRMLLYFKHSQDNSLYIYTQIRKFNYKQLLNNPYVNEVILRWQKLPLKCSYSLELLTYFEKRGLDLSIQVVWNL